MNLAGNIGLIATLIGTILALAASGILLRNVNMRPHITILTEALGAYKEAVDLADRKEAQHLAEIAALKDTVKEQAAKIAELAVEVAQLKVDYADAKLELARLKRKPPVHP